jgi:hypothetical protein
MTSSRSSQGRKLQALQQGGRKHRSRVRKERTHSMISSGTQ